MAGPGIRYHYMAEELSKKFSVTVGFFDASYLPDESFSHSYKTLHIDAFHFEDSFKPFDTVIGLWLSDSMMNFCNHNNIFTVFDVYAPVPVENLASFLYSGKEVKQENDYEYKQSLSMYRKFFANGDLFLFSNHRQLDFWTGYVFGADQVRISNYTTRPFFDRFIYAPMGIDTSSKINHTKDVLKGVVPGIKKTDKVLLWTGGIWGWYDGQVLIRTMKELKKTNPEIKLVFFGTKHPNPAIKEMQESLDTRKLSQELKLTNKNVFFLDGWVDYKERINYLLEADIAVNTHKPSIETEFSHRTRVLDHLLALLPTIGTKGDYLSDEVIKAYDLGKIVSPNNELELKNAILGTLEKNRHATIVKNIKEERLNYDWSCTLEKLVHELENSPSKLTRLPGSDLSTKDNFKKLAKKYIPRPVKKLIIRALRYGK